MDAVLLLNKKKDITSFSCLGTVKKTVDRKVGHCGTLDKFAEGLMIACCGKYTKYVQLFTGFDKRYTACIKFGEETDTLDPEGKVVFTAAVPGFEEVSRGVASLTGKMIQIPPVYSAVHINGKRSYALARQGKQVEPEGREIEIYSSKIISYENGELTVSLNVSKGTYIRSYARDLALMCSSRAYVSALVRTSIGPFLLSEAVYCDDRDAMERFTKGDVYSYSQSLLKTAEEYKKKTAEQR